MTKIIVKGKLAKKSRSISQLDSWNEKRKGKPVKASEATCKANKAKNTTAKWLRAPAEMVQHDKKKAKKDGGCKCK
ncbi:hypothetical protein VP468E531_P0069 [Vibrio phage 468E53-1]|nr:hypothetical protein VP468E531_P0069 [Vibrio phage 468E53-1]CAH9016233.1 hypothetical protein VP177E371_P0068 [Vibrio phage 177E37-1]